MSILSKDLTEEFGEMTYSRLEDMDRLVLKKDMCPYFRAGVVAYTPRWGKPYFQGSDQAQLFIPRDQKGVVYWPSKHEVDLWSGTLPWLWEYWEPKPEHRVHHKPNPYTCRLFKRIDGWILKAMGKNVKWSDTGRLCIVGKGGVGGWETKSFFPGWAYRAAATIQNKWWWTRCFLSY